MNNHNIILFSDRPDIIKSFTQITERNNFSFSLLSDWETLAKVAIENQPGLILVDFTMTTIPEKGTTNIRDFLPEETLAVVICQEEELNKELLASAEFDDYLLYPFLEIKTCLLIWQAEQKITPQTRNKLAMYDLYTGLYNQAFLEQSLTEEIARSNRYQRYLSCLHLDLDQWHNIRQKEGEEVGYLVLRQVGRMLKQTLRAADVACRLSGDDFLVLMPETDLDKAKQAIKRIMAIVHTYPFGLPRQRLVVTFSIGLATIPNQEIETPKQILKLLDEALVQAKKAGGDNFYAYEIKAGLSAKKKSALTSDSPTKVMIVEDNVMNRKIVEVMLRSLGCQVLETDNGNEALKIALQEAPDLIIMDIQLPGPNGYQVTRKLKSQQKTQTIPIIALTANAMPGDAEKALAAGCCAYFAKPVNTRKLADKIKMLLGWEE